MTGINPNPGFRALTISSAKNAIRLYFDPLDRFKTWLSSRWKREDLQCEPRSFEAIARMLAHFRKATPGQTRQRMFAFASVIILVLVVGWLVTLPRERREAPKPSVPSSSSLPNTRPTDTPPVPDDTPVGEEKGPRPDLTSPQIAKLETVQQLLRRSWTGSSSRQKSLQRANSVLSTLPRDVLNPAQPTIRDIRKELIALNDNVSDLPIAYWQIVAQVAGYQYVNNIANFQRESPPECPSVPPNGKLENAVISNCAISLDDKSFEYVTFRHVLIQYSGKALELHGVKFQDCHFELKFLRIPSRGGQVLALGLLKQSDQIIDIG